MKESKNIGINFIGRYASVICLLACIGVAVAYVYIADLTMLQVGYLAIAFAVATIIITFIGIVENSYCKRLVKGQWDYEDVC